MTVSLTGAMYNRIADNIGDVLNDGWLIIYTAPMPVATDDAATGTELVRLRFAAADAFPPAQSGRITANPIGSGAATASGTAAWFRCYRSDLVTPVYDGTVGTTSDVALILTTTAITTGSTVSISTLQIDADIPPPQENFITPEQFGAVGNGSTNDTFALRAMADHVTSLGGGVNIQFGAGKTYIVGIQTLTGAFGQQWSYRPEELMNFNNLNKPITILGNNAIIKCAPGMRYGAFHPQTGQPFFPPSFPFTNPDYVATPYRWMMRFVNCSASITIRDVELDGSVDEAIIGGGWNADGIQIGADAIDLIDNTSTETILNVYAHHHPLDATQIDGVEATRTVRSTFTNYRCEYNGRQGVSIIGGNRYDFIDCIFSHTQRSTVASGPGAGVDLEAEGAPVKHITDLTFLRCVFSNNGGVGLVAANGGFNTSDVDCTDCTFIGTTSHALWSAAPFMSYTGCTFVGVIINTYSNQANQASSSKFFSCQWRDNPALSPTGQVFNGNCVDGASWGVLFSNCTFTMTHSSRMPWTTDCDFTDCTMSQVLAQDAFPRGFFRGTNVITGQAFSSGIHVVTGTVNLNGNILTPATNP